MIPKSIPNRTFDRSKASGLQLQVPGVLGGYPRPKMKSKMMKIDKQTMNKLFGNKKRRIM